jgi:hypothetical protein
MDTSSVVIIQEIPVSEISTLAGTGGISPVTIPISATGSHDIAGLGVPPGKDVTLYLRGGGGGGEGAATAASGGGGGGGGACAIVLVPSGLWILGGSLVIGTGGAGGATAAAPGVNGLDSTLTLNSILQLTAGKGHGGGTATAHHGGVGGVNTFAGSVTEVYDSPGIAGGTTAITDGGAGGMGGGPGGGVGGVGGTTGAISTVGAVPSGGGGGGSVAHVAGHAGANGSALLSY